MPMQLIWNELKDLALKFSKIRASEIFEDAGLTSLMDDLLRILVISNQRIELVHLCFDSAPSTSKSKQMVFLLGIYEK